MVLSLSQNRRKKLLDRLSMTTKHAQKQVDGHFVAVSKQFKQLAQQNTTV